MKKKIVCVIGTRPEAIKMAPVVLRLRGESWADVRVLVTAQHRGMLDQVLAAFDISPDIDLDIMQPNQGLCELTSRLIRMLGEVLADEKADAVLAQGDTTSVMAVALSCFYLHIPFGHVEAGLRTWDAQNPFPEEINRVIAGKLASWHFAPTEQARRNLLREGIAEDAIFVTGNTVIDALLHTAPKKPVLDIELDAGKRLVLITAHRRENFGAPLRNIFLALSALATANQDIQLLYPVHPNPNVKGLAHEILGNVKNVVLCEPLGYEAFVAAMARSYFIITDSGGVQEEAPALGKPVLVLRNETERPEAVSEGVAKLIGTNGNDILREAQHLLDDEAAYRAMARGSSPYGDGRSAERIASILVDALAG